MPILYLACPAPHLGSSVLSAHNGKVLGSLEGPRGTASPVTNCSQVLPTSQTFFPQWAAAVCLRGRFHAGQASCKN